MNFDLTARSEDAGRHGGAASRRRVAGRARCASCATTRSAASREVWKQMGELGWLGLPLPRGGRRLRRHASSTSALVLEQLGTTLVPEPYPRRRSCWAARRSRAPATPSSSERWLAPLVAGELHARARLGRARRAASIRRACATRAERDGGGYRLTRREGAGCSTATPPTAPGRRRAPAAAPATRRRVAVRRRPRRAGRRACSRCRRSTAGARRRVELDGVEVGGRSRCSAPRAARRAVLERALDLRRRGGVRRGRRASRRRCST